MSERYKVLDDDRAYFMTLTVTDWVDVFTRRNHKQTIVKSLDYCCRNKGLEIFAWCLMSNHLHLIARGNEQQPLPETIRDFKKYTAKELVNQIIEEPESRDEWMLERFELAASRIKRVKNFKLWQDGFHPVELFGNKFIKQKILYIHNNPVIEQIVEYPEEYWYSSARNYADRENLLDVIVIAEALRI